MSPIETWLTIALLVGTYVVVVWAATTHRLDRFLGTGTKRGWTETFEHLVTPPSGHGPCKTCGYFFPVDDLDKGLCPECLIVVGFLRQSEEALEKHGLAYGAGLRSESFGDHFVTYGDDGGLVCCSCGWTDTASSIDTALDLVDAHFENPQAASDTEWAAIQRAIDDEDQEDHR